MRQFLAIFIRQLKPNINRNIFFVRVFDFRFRQGRATVEAPVHRLQSAINVAFFHELGEHANFIGFIFERHRRVRIVPIAQHAEPNKILFLPLDLFRCVRARESLRFLDGNILAVGFLDLDFDRHAVAVPARRIGRVEARQRFAFDDDVFEDFVDRVAKVNIAVGVGRPVVQNKFRPAFARFANALIQLIGLPRCDPAGLALGQIALHRERRIGQIQRFLVVSHTSLLRYCLACSTSRSICWRNVSRSGYFSSSRSLCKNSTRTRRP